MKFLALLVVMGGSDTQNIPEDTVEVSQIREASFASHFSDVFICFHKETLGVHNAGAPDVFYDGAVGVFFEFPTQIIFTDVELSGQISQCDILGIVIVDVLDDASDTGLADDAGIFLIHAQHRNHN